MPHPDRDHNLQETLQRHFDRANENTDAWRQHCLAELLNLEQQHLKRENDIRMGFLNDQKELWRRKGALEAAHQDVANLCTQLQAKTTKVVDTKK